MNPDLADDRARTLAYANSEFVDLAGVRTHVQTWAPDGGAVTTVIGLHHFYGSAQTYHRLGPLLAGRGLRLIAFDRVGFGLTDRPDPRGVWVGPDAPYTRAFAIRQLAELLDRLDLPRVLVTGTSMGGTTALEFALTHPSRVAHVLPASAPLTADAAAPPFLRPLLRPRVFTPIGAGVVRRLAGTIDADRVGKSFHDAATVTAEDVDAHARFREADDWARGLWWKFVADRPPSLPRRLPELAAAGVPVTAIGARHDRTVHPRYAARLAELAGGRSVVVDAGHVVHAEGAEELADVIATAAVGD